MLSPRFFFQFSLKPQSNNVVMLIFMETLLRLFGTSCTCTDQLSIYSPNLQHNQYLKKTPLVAESNMPPTHEIFSNTTRDSHLEVTSFSFTSLLTTSTLAQTRLACSQFRFQLSRKFKHQAWVLFKMLQFYTKRLWIKGTGDGFGNQSYLMVHLFAFVNLLVQLRYKKNNAFSFSQCVYNNEPRTFSNI